MVLAGRIYLVSLGLALFKTLALQLCKECGTEQTALSGQTVLGVYTAPRGHFFPFCKSFHRHTNHNILKYSYIQQSVQAHAYNLMIRVPPYISYIQERIPKLASKLSCDHATKKQRLKFLPVVHCHLSNYVDQESCKPPV